MRTNDYTTHTILYDYIRFLCSVTQAAVARLRTRRIKARGLQPTKICIDMHGYFRIQVLKPCRTSKSLSHGLNIDHEIVINHQGPSPPQPFGMLAFPANRFLTYHNGLEFPACLKTLMRAYWEAEAITLAVLETAERQPISVEDTYANPVRISKSCTVMVQHGR
jgi:hypothetical protein